MPTTFASYVGPLPVLVVSQYLENSTTGAFDILPAPANLTTSDGYEVTMPGADVLPSELSAYFPTILTPGTSADQRTVNTVTGGGGGGPTPSSGQLFPLGRS